jgi:hypothetical protein
MASLSTVIGGETRGEGEDAVTHRETGRSRHWKPAVRLLLYSSRGNTPAKRRCRMMSYVFTSGLLEAIPGASEPVHSTFDGLPGDGGESTISGQSRELEGDRPTDNLLYPGLGPEFRNRKEPEHEVAFNWSRGSTLR